jgi:zinc D-Ala-D-Ala dipeptidase
MQELSMAGLEAGTASSAPDVRAYWIEALAAGARFMEAANARPLVECHEPLVSIPVAAEAAGVPIACPRSPHRTGRPRDHRIRSGNVEPLLGVALDLHEQGLTLVIEDALRSLETQRGAVSSHAVLLAFGEMLARVDPDASDREIVARLGAIIAATPKTAGHVAGAAVDVSVLRADGTHLDLGGPYLDFSERMPMASPFVSGEQAEARELIASAMARRGFSAYPFEFWHYSRGDSLATVACDAADPARYGPVHVASDGSVSPVPNVCDPLSEPAVLAEAVRLAMRDAGAR